METIRGSLREHAYFCSYGSDQIRELDRLGDQEYEILSMIQEQRRCLPVNRAGVWHCQECHFYTATLERMQSHLLHFHDPAPADPEELFYEEWH